MWPPAGGEGARGAAGCEGRRAGARRRSPAQQGGAGGLARTLRQHALAELVDHGAQREQALVDGGALLHADALGARLGHALRARQVHQREHRHQDGGGVVGLADLQVAAARLHHLRGEGVGAAGGGWVGRRRGGGRQAAALLPAGAAPAGRRRRRRRTILKTVWERELRSFILVAPVWRLLSPSSSSASTCSGLVTMSSRSPATYTPASLLSCTGSLVLPGASRSLTSSL
jgi:hypothetical protein